MGRLADLFPESIHVFQTGLARFTSDDRIWTYARENGLAIVTADSDFVGMAQRYGGPPKFVRLENCNYKTSRVEELLRRNALRITELDNSPRGVLVLRNT